MQPVSSPRILHIALNSHEIRSNSARKSGNHISHLSILTGDGLHLIPFEEISYCQAEGNYCHVHYNQDQKLLVSRTLKAIEALLPAHSFVRIHQSYVIRVAEIRLIRKDNVVLANGRMLPVSRGNRQLLIARVQEFSSSLT